MAENIIIRNSEGIGKITPLKAIRKKCLNCSGFSPQEVKDCPCFENNGNIEKCHLFPYRFGKKPPNYTGKRAIRKAIRKYCLWCQGGNKKLVSKCLTTDCPLYKFKFLYQPFSKYTHSTKK